MRSLRLHLLLATAACTLGCYQDVIRPALYGRVLDPAGRAVRAAFVQACSCEHDEDFAEQERCGYEASAWSAADGSFQLAEGRQRYLAIAGIRGRKTFSMPGYLLVCSADGHSAAYGAAAFSRDAPGDAAYRFVKADADHAGGIHAEPARPVATHRVRANPTLIAQCIAHAKAGQPP